MPNWCVGNLKFRGKEKDVKRFLETEFSNFTKSSEDDYELKEDTHFGETRAFVYEDTDLWIFDEDENGDFYNSIMVQFAWGCYPQEIERISRKYNIDVRFHGFELGMQFEQICECLRNETVTNDEKKYDDYFWECPMQNLGG